jgi:hypothetical protein
MLQFFVEAIASTEAHSKRPPSWHGHANSSTKENKIILSFFELCLLHIGETPGLCPDLSVLVAQFVDCQASDLRDRIFGPLGLCGQILEARTISADYTKPTARLFPNVTELWITKGSHLVLWKYLNLEWSIRPDIKTILDGILCSNKLTIFNAVCGHPGFFLV